MFSKNYIAIIASLCLGFFVFSGLLRPFNSTAKIIQDDKVKLSVKSGKPYVLANTKQTIPIKISLTGFGIDDLKADDRAPVNIALVLDKSGSMEGDKIKQLREASSLAINLLNKKDIVSLIVYDDAAEVLIPATKLTNKSTFTSIINKIEADGSTALYAGVQQGSEEIQKFLSKEKVNRIILISDGLANVGPSSLGELAQFGSSLREKGISVSTIGLGLDYNEDLMSKLAQKSDGNHAFVENPEDLAKIFQKEFGDILSVAAGGVEVKISCGDGVRPVRVIGREANIQGQIVKVNLNQLYSNQEKYIILEVEVLAGESGKSIKVAKVDVNYNNFKTKAPDNISDSLSVIYTDSRKIAEDKEDKDAMTGYVEQVSAENLSKAMNARDGGNIEEAEDMLKDNASFLQSNSVKYAAPALQKLSEENMQYAGSVSAKPGEWNKQRKQITESQAKSIQQRKW